MGYTIYNPLRDEGYLDDNFHTVICSWSKLTIKYQGNISLRFPRNSGENVLRKSFWTVSKILLVVCEWWTDDYMISIEITTCLEKDTSSKDWTLFIFLKRIYDQVNFACYICVWVIFYCLKICSLEKTVLNDFLKGLFPNFKISRRKCNRI